MRIAIHHRPGSFSERWIEYCKQKNIPYKVVNCYQSDILSKIDDCDALMWHHHQSDYRDVLFARQLLFAMQQTGKKVFPDFNTCWHFDDKVGQKYLLEAMGAPAVSSYVFYERRAALAWIKSAVFPKVFKLRGGAGSANVRLVRTKQQAVRLVDKAFGRGFPQYDGVAALKERYRKYREGQISFWTMCKGTGRILIRPEFDRMHAPEKGYVYFQDYVPGNPFDIRVIVIGDKAFAIKRLVRRNDFRASGSGHIFYEKKELDEKCVRLAFDVNRNLLSQSIAFDFVFDERNNPFIVEVSYGYDVHAYDPCAGYWDSDLNWYPGGFNPQAWMVENLVHSIQK